MKTKIIQFIIGMSVGTVLLALFLFNNPALSENNMEALDNLHDNVKTESYEKLGKSYEKNPTREKMIEVMLKYGFYESEANYIINNCSTRNNPTWCVILFTHTAWHETKTGTEGVGKSRNNLPAIKPCGVNGTGQTFCYHKTYPNRMASFEDRVDRYNQYRFNNDCMGMITRSHYTPHDTGNWISNCERMHAQFYK